MHKITRWGILGTGNIATQFAQDLKLLPNAQLVAIGSRSALTAGRFGERFGIAYRYASYEDVAYDPNVDIVYIATPHVYHRDNILLCLHEGKAVLCEKPLALNAQQVEEVIQYARARKLFLMEALWTRFLPITATVNAWLSERRIGEVRILLADAGYRSEWEPQGRVLNAQLGGGALLDMGIYPLALASMIFGLTPPHLVSTAHLGETGVDEQAAMTLRYGQGQLATLSCAIRTKTPSQATILGTSGAIRIHPPFWCAREATLSVRDKADETVQQSIAGNGYCYEASAVMACLRRGQMEEVRMPLNESLATARIMDRMRAEWGLKYPTEATLP